MMMKFYDFEIHEKLMKEGIQEKKLSDLDLRSDRNPCLKINKNP